jgi:hypothetical protein
MVVLGPQRSGGTVGDLYVLQWPTKDRGALGAPVPRFHPQYFDKNSVT